MYLFNNKHYFCVCVPSVSSPTTTQKSIWYLVLCQKQDIHKEQENM